MASSKKSLMDKFSLEAKPKSPGKKSKKGSKASKSLSRELAKPPSGSGKKKAQKSLSDSVVGEMREDETKRDDKVKLSEKTVSMPQTRQAASSAKDADVTKEPAASYTDETRKKLFTDSGKHAVEKLDTALVTTWHKPIEMEVDLQEEIDTPHLSSESTSTHDATIESLSTSNMSVPPGSPMDTSDKNSNTSVSSISSTPNASVSMVSCGYSSDSLAGEMESYKLGVIVKDSQSGSEIETIRDSCDDINISECSSTSTPIKFALFEEKKEHTDTVKRRPPPKFSLIREAASEKDDFDSLSLSSDYSPTTMSNSLKSLEGRNRHDDFSDESDSSAKFRESTEHSDDSEYGNVHFVPLNKQLQIVTSLDRLDRSPRRRSHSPPKSGDGLFHQVSSRLPFVDFMRRCGLSTYLYNLPGDMTLDKFRYLTRKDLIDRFNIVDPSTLERLQKAINRAREIDTDEEVR